MHALPIHGVSVVIAVCNEIENIEPLLAEVYEALSKIDHFEIVVVDDGSKDGTSQLLTQLSQRYPQLKIVSHPRNYGQSIAVISGVRAASYHWVITMDGDGQNDPAD